MKMQELELIRSDSYSAQQVHTRICATCCPMTDIVMHQVLFVLAEDMCRACAYTDDAVHTAMPLPWL